MSYLYVCLTKLINQRLRYEDCFAIQSTVGEYMIINLLEVTTTIYSSFFQYLSFLKDMAMMFVRMFIALPAMARQIWKQY